MAEIQFAIMKLIEENVNSGERFIFPTNTSFNCLEDQFTYSKDKTLYEISVEKTNDYIYFIFDFGNPEPRDENLTNINTRDKVPNQRTEEEVELTNQAFFLFHYRKQYLYVSNSLKKSLFASILKEKLQTNFEIQNLYKNETEFINAINECNRICFTHINNLFSNDSPQKQALIDLTGTDAPEEFTIITKYKKNNKIVEFIKQMCQAKRDEKISALTICGIDEEGFEAIYNVETFQQKIKISCQKDKNGKFKTDEIRNNLLNEIAK